MKDYNMLKMSKVQLDTNGYKDDVEFESLQFYIEQAKICMKRNLFTKTDLIDDEDAVSYVAYNMMLADWAWDGRGTKQGYRYYRGKYAVIHLLRNKKRNCGLNTFDFINDNIPNHKTKSTLSQMIDYEDLLTISKEVDKLPEMQALCIKYHYYKNMSLRKIGEKLDMSKQAVHQHIKKGLSTLRKRV